MKIIIPMAGRGSRLRPHTLTVPKPLVPVAGKPIVQRIVEDLSSSFKGQIDEIAFIIGDFGQEVETHLVSIAESLGAKGTIYHQDQPLGTAHAILCAADSLDGNCLVAFADTLFRADFSFDPNAQDGLIWVKTVEDPSAYGVVLTDENDKIIEFIEKSPVFVSDKAIVGIYYFKDGQRLKKELQYLIDNDIKQKGEYSLTSALENLKEDNAVFKPAIIDEWLDCGNKDFVVYSNQRILDIKKNKEQLIDSSATIENSTIIEPCYIGPNVQIKNAVVGPYVSVGENSKLENCVIKNSLVQNDSSLKNVVVEDSMLGNKASFEAKARNLSLGDFTNYSE